MATKAPIKHQRSALRIRSGPHPLEGIFAAKKANDEARTRALRALASWTSGDATYEALSEQLLAWQASQSVFVEAIQRQKDFVFVEELSVVQRRPDEELQPSGADTK